MSWWTHTRGIMVVNCCYGTQFDLDRVMKEIIVNASTVTGSESNLEIRCVQDPGYDTSVYRTVFDGQEEKQVRYEWQTRYSLILNGDFRDKILPETKKELESLLWYLGCRLLVDTCYIEMYDDFDKKLYTRDSVLSNNGLALKEMGTCKSGCAVDAVRELNLFDDQIASDVLYTNCDTEDMI